MQPSRARAPVVVLKVIRESLHDSGVSLYNAGRAFFVQNKHLLLCGNLYFSQLNLCRSRRSFYRSMVILYCSSISLYYSKLYDSNRNLYGLQGESPHLQERKLKDRVNVKSTKGLIFGTLEILTIWE
jgi:hypothetical protein